MLGVQRKKVKMKAFEKWWEASGRNKRGVWEFKWLGKLVWRACVEWVQQTAKKLDEEDAPIGMDDVLKYELEDN